MAILDLNKPSDVARYNAFVSASPFGRLQQDSAWGHVKANWLSFVVIVEEEGKILAGMHILAIKALADRYFFYCCRGPVLDLYDKALFMRLLKEAEPLIEKYHPFLSRFDPEVLYDEKLVEMYQDVCHLRSRGNVGNHDTSNPRLNMILHVQKQSFKDIFDQFSSSCKRGIQRAFKHQVYTRRTQDTSYLKDFYRLQQEMSLRKGVSIRPLAYFERLMASFKESYLFLTYVEDELVNATIGVYFNHKFFYMYGASSDTHRESDAGFQAQYEMIRFGVELGMKEYDMGAVYHIDHANGLYRFKHGFCKEDYTEFIGELDFVFDASIYQAFVAKETRG